MLGKAHSDSVCLDPAYKWRFCRIGKYDVFSIGREETVRELLASLPEYTRLDKETLKKDLLPLRGNFAVIVDAPDRTLAVVDKIRGYPIFYVERDRKFRVSNSARLLKEVFKLSEVDDLSLLEFNMAGYVTGRETLYRDLFQLQAGEIAIWDKRERGLVCERYYIFYSDKIRDEKEDVLIDELDERTNAIFQRNMEDAAGRPICVPLSGGLDSRLVLCKLKQHGYDNLRSFSYGPPGNYEARVARCVAQTIDVPWTFVPSLRQEAREFFWSDQRKKYWEFADGLSLPPNVHAFLSLRTLIASKRLPRDSVIINGQSGDFITGQHIPDLEGQSPGYDVLFSNIMAKHFKQRADFLQDVSNQRRISEKILSVLGELLPLGISGNQDMAKQYELWEWQERQCKRVVHGQRNYDFFGLSWELPLWDFEYLEFWSEVPLHLKMKRQLFVDYLKKMNFFNLFKEFKPFTSRWPRHLMMIQYIGHVMKFLFGERISGKYYRYLDYWSLYSNLYAQTPYSRYCRLCQNYASPLAFFIDIWKKENMS